MPLKNLENRKKYANSYNHSVRGIVRRKKYQHSKKGITAGKKYAHSERGKLAAKKADRKYVLSEKGKIITKRALAKRKRKLGFTLLMSNPFPKEISVDYHHINNMFVVPVPRQVHKSMLGKNHRIKVNDWIEEIIGNVGV